MLSKLFMFMLVSSTAQAAIIRPLDEMRVLEIPISQQAPTRIKVQEDRILHIFGNTGEYTSEVDEVGGQVFIRPLETARPISLTLTTEGGHTQDLRLIPKDQAPEALILKGSPPFKDKSAKERKRSSVSQEDVESLILACQDGRIPLGYIEVPLRLPKRPQRYGLIRELQSKTLRGLIYRVQNQTQKPRILDESEVVQEILTSQPVKEGSAFQKNALIALLIPNKTLAPGERTDVYVVARTN